MQHKSEVGRKGSVETGERRKIYTRKWKHSRALHSNERIELTAWESEDAAAKMKF